MIERLKTEQIEDRPAQVGYATAEYVEMKQDKSK